MMHNFLSIIFVIIIGLVLTFGDFKEAMELPNEDEYIVNNVAWIERKDEELSRWLK